MSYRTPRAATALTACFAAVASCLVAAGPASANTNADEATMRDTWNTYDVPASTQDRLLDELTSGGTWDSLEGKTPIATESTIRSGTEETVARFADGSISVTEVELPTAGGARASLSGCKILSQTHYDSRRFCNVSTNVVVASAAYTVTYRVVQGGPSSIVSRSSASAMVTRGYLGNISKKQMVTSRTTQSGSSPAVVTGRWTWTSNHGAGSRDYWLQFNVRGTSTWAQNN
ncbi:hypothetical protein GCM10017714_13140 [Curtobacterium pusillum]|uniref:Tat pathway signal sequence domain protein n=1 Tax=Curtobacterium pusillum TaxID=69373 RepID=A0ABX2MCS6_9MICO|nr:hypothetical protein [Curtobacterium pusillum]NUU13146.1 hypothetical protein [Curtobacterium pusillum]GLK30575.1 hypothetical protein GCM10017610_08600 [Curtobacterium pusillum]